MGRDGLQTDGYFVPPAAGRLAQEEQVYEKCRRPAIMPDEIGHQNIENVGVEGESFHSGKHYSSCRYPSCDDVAATYRQLQERGVEFVKEPQKQPWGEFAIFRDPDGNQLVLSSA